MAEESVPVVLLRNRVPRPVGKFGIEENDPCPFVLRVRVAPHIPVTLGIIPRTARLLEPRVLVRSMVQYHLHNDSDSALVGSFKEKLEIVQRAVFRMYRA